jgi:hypothetical protein
MKLPSKTPTARPKPANRPPSGIRPATSHQVTPQNVFAGHCEQICSRILDPVLRERCLRTCGY